ncbi:MAG: geranylgeranylglyceryl/heptaprenylglyceryl phosphate synthase [Candidatus Micrarchaeales archaeon]|nr:geranylgeranylglyceryl/heptaprenylglyceryl phosphate synthase [Candidatus Micrarchaeales archaeon]
MKIGKVELYIHELLESKGAGLITLIDPVDYDTPDAAIKTAKATAEGGADIMLLGGSIGAQGELLDYVTKSIKESVDIPVVLFPGNIATISKYADAIYFMSLLNARNPYWIVQAQMLAAPLIRESKIEPLSLGYILVSPGGTAGWVGDAGLIPREKPKIAAALALTAQYFGYRMILTDTGSNPKLQGEGHIPNQMISAVKSVIDVPYIVGGGITTPLELKEVLAAGADMVQIGTAFEGSLETVQKRTRSFATVIKEEGAKKMKKA